MRTELQLLLHPQRAHVGPDGGEGAGGLFFSIKAFRGITHEREDPEPQIEQFTDALAPLIDAEKFACVLAQFPHSFHANQTNRDYLRRVREGFGDLPVVVELGSRDWISERTFDELRALNFGFCCVDQPRFRSLVPPVAVVTGPVAYARFHGRNYEVVDAIDKETSSSIHWA